jgi:hypothetical protein
MLNALSGFARFALLRDDFRDPTSNAYVALCAACFDARDRRLGGTPGFVRPGLILCFFPLPLRRCTSARYCSARVAIAPPM